MTDITRRRILASGTTLAASFASSKLSAQRRYDPGASDTEIKLGHTSPYSGPLSAFSVAGKATTAYFNMINAAGGINGRKIKFISYDDGYQPPKTVEMVRKLVESDEVLMIFQLLGTPTNIAIQKYLNQKQIPQLFIFSGASRFGDPKNYPWTMGWQPDYATEGGVYAKHILASVKDARIGILFQNDDSGKDGVIGFQKALGKQNEKMIAAIASYEVTDPTVDSQIIQLKNAGANVFLNLSSPKFAAQGIRKAYDLAWRPVHYLTSPSASVQSVMKPAGFEAGQDIMTIAYLKDPTDPQWANDPEFLEWKRWMEKWNPSASVADTLNVYPYALTATLVEVLKRCGDELTRANVMKQASNLRGLHVPMLLPGISINTSPTDFYPIQSLRLARFKGETWELFGNIISNESE
ncbi:MAG: branched-chain amino acid transport system substrate-binding protein [Rhodospirillaceae bacterium]|jgi:branched-chain amino acid transport system substrate-binding protein|nr:branched-chain amino acid transport system substrate-binding protein [Rhodospirillaceae bacterium]MEA2811278.1 branched-chain amino acid transport system substrate-binding protein [Rhodospirillaceae bacterium]